MQETRDERATTQHTTRLLLIRHGQSVANVEGRMQGSGNDPLTLLGEEQAAALARCLHAEVNEPAIIFCSPLQRAIQTAEIVAQHLQCPLQIRPGLEEIGLGRLENVDAATLEAVVRANTFEQYDAELPEHFAVRVAETISTLLKEYHGHTLVIITHLGVVCNALAFWLRSEAVNAWKEYGGLENTAISELHIADNGRAWLVRHNDAEHLTAPSMH
jgi:broad specificity phosphatase PhoE